MKRTYSLEEFGVKKHEMILRNGLKVIFIQKPFSPIFAKMMIRAGSIYNSSDNGLAHFTEHVIVGASKKYPQKELFAQVINNIGGETNAHTANTWMSIECEVAIPEHLPFMKEHFSQALSDIYITPKLLEKEKGVIISEIKKSTSDPAYNAGRFVRKIVAQNTSWSNSNLGTVDSVNEININEVTEFFNKYCTVENMVLTVCGGCTVFDIEQTFSDILFLTGGTKAFLPKDPEVLLPKQRIFFEQDIDQTNIGLMFHGPRLGSRESIILTFVLKHAHQGFDSRFFKKIRNERGLAYRISFGGIGFDELRYFGTDVSVAPVNVDKAIDTILECYQDLAREGMTEAQIKSRIDRVYFTDKRNFERSVDWVNAFDDYLYEDPNPLIGDYPDCFNFWQTITSEEVHSVLKEYINLENFHLMINGRQTSKKYF